MTVGKLKRKGCMAYLAYVIDLKRDYIKLSNLLIVREFQMCFQRSY